jgi:hypothetical protein
MMPGFFKQMPDKGKRWERGVHTVSTFRIVRFLGVVDEEVYTVKGTLIKAYIIVRLDALLRDWWTWGNGYGIGWSLNWDKNTK